MIALVYVTIAVVVIYILFSYLKFESNEPISPNANLEKSPEEMPLPTYRPFRDGPFQMTMGLQSLNTHEWIQIDRNYREELVLKENLLNSNRRCDIFICKDEAYGGAMETLQMLIEHLPNQYPNMFQRNHSRTKITNLITGQTFSLTEPDHKHPLEIASLLVQEDLVIMQRPANEETYYANALAVCFPSGWLPKSKFGLPLAFVHMPHVPFFQEKLRASMDRYFLKLKEDSPVQRVNWTLQIGNELCHTAIEETDGVLITKENVGELMYLRTERQTLRRLPKSNTILFTIKTYTTSIKDVCKNEPLTAKRLAGAVRNWPPEMIKYKGAAQYKDGLLEYLDMMSSF
ncbi:unnamed protein product [Adineta ricciae]|uniref:DUF3445 domain-containing protein n=1 Tax=Adineta ricciae TaxID=249248 RepID=A0A815SIX9_ADIRI|nr:unnamed protein product [Adineta ricciae]